MVDARLESKVDEHDRMLIEIQVILKGMVESQTKMANGMGDMACAIGKIDLWLEKITNLDGNTKESFKRSYKTIEELEEKVDEGFKDLEVARFFSKYPKLLALVIIGFCVLSIDPIRKIIFGV